MRKPILLLLSASAVASNLSAGIVDDYKTLASTFDNYDTAKTFTAITNMAKSSNIGLEAFRASSLKGSLYTSSCGVTFVKGASILGYSTSMTIEGFYNGNFDLPLTYNGFFSPSTDELTARETKPDGSAGDYVGKVAKITPCIVIKDVVYVPISLDSFTLPLMGYYTNDDATGLDNICFNAANLDNIAEMLLKYIDKDTLADIIKQAIQSQSDNEVVSGVLGSIVDTLVDSDAVIALLDDAKFNAFRLEIYDPDANNILTRTTEYYNGYEIRSIAKTYDVTDRVITDITGGSVPMMGYGTKKEDSDITRTYGIAYAQDADGNVTIYNFNNSGFAIRSSIEKDADSGSKQFVTTLSPVTGKIDIASSIFTLDDRQQLSCTPSVNTSLLGGNLNTMNVSLLWPVESSSLSSTKVHPAWSSSAQIQSSVTAGSLSHQGDSRWAVDCGGSLSTTIDNATITLGDYAPVTASLSAATGSATPLYTTNGPIVYGTTWTISDMTGQDVDCTTAVSFNFRGLDIEANTFGDEHGVWGAGTIECDAHGENVEKYEVYITPTAIADVSKPYISALSNGSSLYKLDADSGLQYRFKSGTSLSSWTHAYNLTNYSVNKPQGNEFEFFIPYSDLKVYNYVKSGILSYKWTEASASADNAYTLYVKVTYNEDCGLQPTFHALTSFVKGSDILTGVSDSTFASVKVAAVNGVITVSDAQGQEVAIYNLSGAQLHKANGDTSYSAAAGAYIVRIGTAATKVILK